MGTSWLLLCDNRCQLVPSSDTCLVGYELTSIVVRVDITCGTSWHLLVVRVAMGTSWHGYELTWGELTWVRVDWHPIWWPRLVFGFIDPRSQDHGKVIPRSQRGQICSKLLEITFFFVFANIHSVKLYMMAWNIPRSQHRPTLNHQQLLSFFIYKR